MFIKDSGLFLSPEPWPDVLRKPRSVGGKHHISFFREDIRDDRGRENNRLHDQRRNHEK